MFLPVKAFSFGGNTHNYIANQAFVLFTTPELDKYKPTIVTWAVDEDNYNYTNNGCINPFLLVGQWGWCKEPHAARDHFWDIENNVGYLGIFPSAYEKAADYWERANITYIESAGDKTEAYKFLGAVAHLLSDMGSPAHVHNDDHFFSDVGGGTLQRISLIMWSCPLCRVNVAII